MRDYQSLSYNYSCFKNNSIRFIGFGFSYYGSNVRFICSNIDSSLRDYEYGSII
jgi:hypothetical protein